MNSPTFKSVETQTEPIEIKRKYIKTRINRPRITKLKTFNISRYLGFTIILD